MFSLINSSVFTRSFLPHCLRIYYFTAFRDTRRKGFLERGASHRTDRHRRTSKLEHNLQGHPGTPLHLAALQLSPEEAFVKLDEQSSQVRSRVDHLPLGVNHGHRSVAARGRCRSCVSERNWSIYCRDLSFREDRFSVTRSACCLSERTTYQSDFPLPALPWPVPGRRPFWWHFLAAAASWPVRSQRRFPPGRLHLLVCFLHLAMLEPKSGHCPSFCIEQNCAFVLSVCFISEPGVNDHATRMLLRTENNQRRDDATRHPEWTERSVAKHHRVSV